MTRPKKYKKSLKQIMKESVKNSSVQEQIWYSTPIIGKSKLMNIIKQINNEPDKQLKNKLIKSLSIKSKKASQNNDNIEVEK